MHDSYMHSVIELPYMYISGSNRRYVWQANTSTVGALPTLILLQVQCIVSDLVLALTYFTQVSSQIWYTHAQLHVSGYSRRNVW